MKPRRVSAEAVFIEGEFNNMQENLGQTENKVQRGKMDPHARRSLLKNLATALRDPNAARGIDTLSLGALVLVIDEHRSALVEWADGRFARTEMKKQKQVLTYCDERGKIIETYTVKSIAAEEGGGLKFTLVEKMSNEFVEMMRGGRFEMKTTPNPDGETGHMVIRKIVN